MMMPGNTELTALRVLTMEPSGVADLVPRLDEANRYLLAVAMTKLLLSMGTLVTRKEAEAYGRMFQSLGPARLKFHIWSQLIGADEATFPHRTHTATIVHEWVGTELLTNVFGVPMGPAGMGHAPQLGMNDNDRFDCFVLMQHPRVIDLASFYAKLVADARLHSTIIVDETV